MLTKVSPEQFKKNYPHSGDERVAEVWRSRKFLVVVYNERGHCRVTINRAELDQEGGWLAGITWDEIQKIKRDIGRGEMWAVECYPPDSEVVNVANMRHIWLLPGKPDYGWTTKKLKEGAA